MWYNISVIKSKGGMNMKRKLKKLNVYVDMDGVLADFNNEPNALERFKTERDFFKVLKPINKFAFEQLLSREDVNVFILTASPNKQADKDKRAWLKYYYPKLKKSHIIICRLGQNKADFMKTKTGILLDDYGKNCNKWREKGNVAIKIERPLQEHFHEFLEMYLLDF